MSVTLNSLIVACHLPRALSYGGVRTWVEGSQMRENRALAGASNLLGYKEYTQKGLNLLKDTSFLTYNRLTQALAKH